MENRKKKEYSMKAEAGSFTLSGSPVDIYVKRGDLSVTYLVVIYGVILTLVVGIVQLVEGITWYHKIIAIVLLAILFFILIFFGKSFRIKIISLFSKIKEYKE